MPSTDSVLRQLTEVGCRTTLSRRNVVGFVVEQTSSFTAQQACEALDQRGVARATVFRTLNLLHQLGLLNRLHTGDGCHRYTLCEPQHHHHLVCTRCGLVYALEGCLVDSTVRDAARAVGFTVLGHNVEVFGCCAQCASPN